MKVVVVDPEIVEVNGVRYQPRPRSGRRMSKSMLSAMLMAEAMSAGMGYGFGKRYERERPVVNIVEEYGRIQRKESKLGKNDRDWVEAQFESNYMKV